MYSYCWGALLLHEHIAPMGVLGSLLIAVGVVTVNHGQKRQEQRQQEQQEQAGIAGQEPEEEQQQLKKGQELLGHDGASSKHQAVPQEEDADDEVLKADLVLQVLHCRAGSR